MLNLKMEAAIFFEPYLPNACGDKLAQFKLRVLRDLYAT
jgi:hypothetical protein